jgi:CheY-like chemotaxis protein
MANSLPQDRSILVAGVPETFGRLRVILHGYPVRFVSTLREAEKMLHDTRPDLLLLSVHFDDGNIYELLQFVKASHRLAGCPIICYRATFGAETRSRMAVQAVEMSVLSHGATAFIDIFEPLDQYGADAALRTLVIKTLREATLLA